MRDWFLYRDKKNIIFAKKKHGDTLEKKENEMLRIGNEFFLLNFYTGPEIDICRTYSSGNQASVGRLV